MKILIIEDNKDIAANIADYFEPLGHTLDFAADGLTGLHLAVTQRFDVIVLDLMLPGMDGITLCQKLRQEGKMNTPVIMLTARDQLDDKLMGFQVGADDYLVKPFSLKELEVRVQALFKRSQTSAVDRNLNVADLQYNPDTLETYRLNQKLELNPIQRRLLDILMQNSGRVVSREELERHIWGDILPDNDVLRTHIYSLRSIIDKPFTKKLLHTIHGAGYRLYDDSRSGNKK
ncbi:MAG: DNA-binding response regulator [SAR86 cluster bacterium]|uniref:DNA-binding response regulator n=1 Tax=SAR86 cluster bacterium TaxID=2030880 RepID=A0A2A5CGR7_9GAMM|nr:response regulator transcription factor [bacterium AH-315-I11]MBN4075296.1 response regulator transcription factor [Gammaproteobacteria bacterium AH-315-E17]PCJ42952.1 MAG: DNA-binding response regulator [SAR86 cluster bacterium]